MKNDSILEERIRKWREYLLKRQPLCPADADELEDHLRSQVEALRQAGLDEDEAFFVAVKRLGDLDAISREFAIEYSERLWKQLVVSSEKEAPSAIGPKDAVLAIGLAAASAVAIKVPSLFGLEFSGPGQEFLFYLRNLSLFVLPFLAIFFGLKRAINRSQWVWVFLPFIAGGLVMNLFSFKPDGQTQMLSIIHLPIALWLMGCYAYAGGEWRNHAQRMNYIRFSGEWFIYYALIAFGGGVLIGLTVFIFEAIGINVEQAVNEWMLPCGATGAVLVSAWLVEHKKSVIENMAPVLTWLFTPLFAALLLVFIVIMAVTGNTIKVEREVLIGFDLLLILVLGLVLYAISARDPQEPPGRFDLVQLLLVTLALIVDGIALGAMVARISVFGFSPNKTAALGLNLLLIVNLTWSAVLYACFLLRRSPAKHLERWQTSFLLVFAAWAWFVAVFFPLIFNFQ